MAVLAAGALVASLLAVGSGPAGADIDKADHTTALSACVGDAVKDQMFTDVSDEHAFKDAINCIAYYGVTNGTGDGSTYSPNDGVTRAQMAVLIARAAGVAGVDLDDPMGDKFDDIGDTWGGARDAVNQLADAGMISSGGDFRPDDVITRAEMAHFLVGLLVKAASNVTKNSAGDILLGSPSAAEADDHFGDARAALPRANDAEVSALYELGITKGASAAAGADDTKPPLDFNYEPHGTVNRGQMAAFITRALAHTSARPAGVSAQYDGTSVVVSVRDGDFQPRSNVVVDMFETDTGGVDLAFRADGTCGEVIAVGGAGGELCKIEADADPITGGDGDAEESLDGVDPGGTVVWVWTGDDGDTVDDDTVDGDTDLYRLDISETDAPTAAARASFGTDFAGAKQKLGSSVLYTLQLRDDKGEVSVGADAKKPASYSVVVTTHRYTADGTAIDGNALSVVPRTLTTDSDGKATLTVSAPSADRDKDSKVDKYRVAVTVVSGENAPSDVVDADGTALPSGGVQVVFSTEPGVVEAADIKVSVKPDAEFVAADAAGASNRAKVTVTDQYGDPIRVKVQLASNALAAGDSIHGGRMLTVGGDGSYTFRYTRKLPASATETLTATTSVYDHDGDGCTTALIGTDDHRCNPSGTPPLAAQTGTAAVQWAAAAAADNSTAVQIRAFDTDTNTVFAGGDGSVVVVRYDSNDRFDLDRGATGTAAASNYAVFEKNLSKETGNTLAWDFAGDGPGNSRAVNLYTLTTPATS